MALFKIKKPFSKTALAFQLGMYTAADSILFYCLKMPSQQSR